ncbi:MAG: S1C family serine protease [Bacillota bacterium]|jgi:serine protease Do
MAKYRIIRHPEEQQPQELAYWQITPDENQISNLDLEEINELNQQPDNNFDDMPYQKGNGCWGVMIAIIMITAFLMLSFSGIIKLSKLPDLGFLRQSAQLSEDPLVASLKQSVVNIISANTQGTGFNISEDGLIITNNHIVQNKKILTIIFPDGRSFITKNWQSLPEVDLAVIDIDGENMPALDLADDEIKIDDEVIFIGNPLGFDWTVAQGKVLQEQFSLNNWPTKVILLEGPVYPGSSGSPVFNSQGEVVAVVFATLKGRENTGLAVPISALFNK